MLPELAVAAALVCMQVERTNDNFVQINCKELQLDQRCKPVPCPSKVTDKNAVCYKCDMQAPKKPIGILTEVSD